MKRVGFIGTLIVLFVLTGCSKQESSVLPSQQIQTDAQIGDATISSIEVLASDSNPKEIRILIQGILPSACANLEEISVEQIGQVFNLTAPYSLATNPDCAQNEIQFDKVITLQTNDLAAGDYQLHAGSVTAGFTIGSSQVADAQSSPTGTPVEPTPTQSAPVEPSPTPTLVPELASIPPTPGCTNKVAFYADVTVPDRTPFKQGDKFTKTWRLKNEGTCDIDPAYSLVFASGDPLNGPLTEPMPAIPAGTIGDVSLDLTAPSQGGIYGANYEFRDPSGNRFGVNSNGIDYIWVEIAVSWTVGEAGNTVAAGAPIVPVTISCSYTENPGYVQELLNLVNQARSAQGVAPLSANTALMAAAKTHSLDMGCNDFLDHTGSDGSKARDRVAAQGYDPSYSAENIYAGTTQFGGDAQGAFDWWINSPVHLKNILNPKPTEIGIAFVDVPTSTFGGYYTMVFAKSK